MKPPRRDFWFAVTLAALALTSVYLWNQNRALSISNQQSLVQLCSTTAALDMALVVPLLTETRAAIEFLPPGPDRLRAQRLEANLEVAHAELSETMPCDQVS